MLKAKTSLNFTFNITNLPTGHLAEGTITSYNTNGTPKTATITIDNDANGVGWFIDTTPQDNSEFTGVNTYLLRSHEHQPQTWRSQTPIGDGLGDY
ncbi:hypothetical protein [Chamaesiphon sp.]|uniref:hypothetical protein n=1 Tax=Chamaesiphon sp. TaxID=2814140 RepID=UPI0035941555